MISIAWTERHTITFLTIDSVLRVSLDWASILQATMLMETAQHTDCAINMSSLI